MRSKDKFCHLSLLEFADDAGLFHGLKFYNDALMEAGPDGNVESEIILKKDVDSFTFKEVGLSLARFASTVINA